MNQRDIKSDKLLPESPPDSLQWVFRGRASELELKQLIRNVIYKLGSASWKVWNYGVKIPTAMENILTKVQN